MYYSVDESMDSSHEAIEPTTPERYLTISEDDPENPEVYDFHLGAYREKYDKRHNISP